MTRLMPAAVAAITSLSLLLLAGCGTPTAKRYSSVGDLFRAIDAPEVIGGNVICSVDPEGIGEDESTLLCSRLNVRRTSRSPDDTSAKPVFAAFVMVDEDEWNRWTEVRSTAMSTEPYRCMVFLNGANWYAYGRPDVMTRAQHHLGGELTAGGPPESRAACKG